MRRIFVKPIVSEKSSAQLESGKYMFWVSDSANKIEIKKCIETEFGVKVESVNTLITHGKKRRRGKIVGQMADRKKAVVTLKAGESIDAVKGIF